MACCIYCANATILIVPATIGVIGDQLSINVINVYRWEIAILNRLKLFKGFWKTFYPRFS